MKNFTAIFIIILMALGCSSENIEDLEPNILEDDSIPLVVFSNPTISNNRLTVSFTSIYDQLSPESQEKISHYNVYKNDIEASPLPLTATTVSGSGVPGNVICLSIAFDSSEGESRRSGTYCKQLP